MSLQTTKKILNLCKYWVIFLPFVILELLWFLNQGSFGYPIFFLRAWVVLFVYVFVFWLRSASVDRRGLQINLAAAILIILAILGGGLTLIFESEVGAWVGLAAFLALSLHINETIAGNPFAIRWWICTLIVGGLSSSAPVIYNQILMRFSEEEFFTALQAVCFFIFWLSFVCGTVLIKKKFSFSAQTYWVVPTRFLLSSVIVVVALSMIAMINGYQGSFYDQNVHTFPGISETQPFICGATTTGPGSQSNQPDFTQAYIEKLAALPDSGVPESGFLYLVTGDVRWASEFHDALLREASENLFTKPANSVKFDQYLASLRVYNYARILEKSPNLFTKSEQAQVENWFHAINRRAMTVEWVDWMYGIAFSSWPAVGLYENQENGAGLIALLETEQLADPDLSRQNQEYLAQNPRGWNMRFRNTDDSLNYQGEWVYNAYFQSRYTGKFDPVKMKNSFEWLLLQMLPDGRTPQYNLSYPYTLADNFAFAAAYLNDPRFLWLAERAASYAATLHPVAALDNGLKGLAALSPQPPSHGSCLLFGDSGLPTQVGPLAPDKVVFRQGWSENDLYLLLNLRYSGWHRYKGTNTVTLIDQAGPLVNEQIMGKDFFWLPKGRAAFRDKRIPRENLNGFQVYRSGLDAVLYKLLGFGGPWAQDPPLSAQVDEFITGSDIDISQTSLVNWHGWTQKRKIYFAHNGIVIVVDDAVGPVGQAGAVSWNIQGGQQKEQDRFLLENEKNKAEMLLLSPDVGTIDFSSSQGDNNRQAGQIFYIGAPDGHLRLVTILLTGEWQSAQAQLLDVSGKSKVQINGSNQSFEIELDPFSR